MHSCWSTLQAVGLLMVSFKTEVLGFHILPNGTRKKCVQMKSWGKYQGKGNREGKPHRFVDPGAVFH